MRKSDVIEALVEDARTNGATNAVVVDVPPEVLREAGAAYSDGKEEDDSGGGFLSLG